MKKKKIDINFFKCKTPDMLYVLGFFAADGSLSINKAGGHYFSFYSMDQQIISDIRKAMKSSHKLSKRIDKKTGNSCYRFQVGSRVMCEDLMKLGFAGNKTRNLPTLKLELNELEHFVRGYFDGDGNVWSGIIHKYRKTSHINVLLAFTSASGDFLAFLKDNLMSRIGTTGSLFKGKKNYHRLQYSKKDAFKIYNFMYNTDTSFLVLYRKKKIFDNIIKNTQP